ncbi:Uma2 family endonuclease [Nocardia caishijiensis]|uniref:Uma2 family endonuclease n=1 Tax=Nocardia caishijiensis TaxID=184756 RepID=A0ABQ6YT44_9NOCA|nr:Uma2 family endonuclease [Nocardia caishijiensis]KAF0848808.1 Uma2 family endonuclease [Nocardia caishijiensis]
MPVPRSDHWTAVDLEQLPDDGSRYEVLNGQLVVTVAPKPVHQWLIKRLTQVLYAAVPADRLVLDGVGVLIGDDEPIPDLMVVEGSIDWHGRGVPVGQVELAVEVVSRSTTLQDRMVKPVLYAQAGIPTYWRFEINSFRSRLADEQLPVLFAYSLGADGEYMLTHRASAGVPVALRTPFEVTFDPGVLLPR